MNPILLSLPAHQRKKLVQALESGMLGFPATLGSVKSVLGRSEGAADILEALKELEGMGMAGPAIASWLKAYEDAVSQFRRPDLVWSGPEVPGLHARDTRRVFEELLGSAKRSVWACSFAYFDGPKAFEILAKRMDSTPGLKVTLMLNIQRRWGDTTSADDLVRKFADRFWKEDWPGVARPKVYYDPRSLAPEGPKGVLHAKAVVVDDEAVFITSANFTEAALDRNIEMGLLIRDRALALSVISHFSGLINETLVNPLPEA